MGKFILVITMIAQLAVTTGQLLACLAVQGELLLRMQWTHVQFVDAGRGWQLLVVSLLLGLNGVILGDLEALVSLYTAIADILGAIDTPGGGHCIVRAATTLNHDIGQFGGLVGASSIASRQS